VKSVLFSVLELLFALPIAFYTIVTFIYKPKTLFKKKVDVYDKFLVLLNAFYYKINGKTFDCYKKKFSTINTKHGLWSYQR